MTDGVVDESAVRQRVREIDEEPGSIEWHGEIEMLCDDHVDKSGLSLVEARKANSCVREIAHDEAGVEQFPPVSDGE